MEIIIQINGQALPVEVSVEVYAYLDQAAHKDENLAHEQRRHWDMRELDEYIIVILSILVDTFSTRITMPKLPYPEIHNISGVSS